MNKLQFKERSPINQKMGLSASVYILSYPVMIGCGKIPIFRQSMMIVHAMKQIMKDKGF